MHGTFTLNEAQALIPTLKKLFIHANEELAEIASELERVNKLYTDAEKKMDLPSPPDETVESLRLRRSDFQDAISELSRVQNWYVDRVECWVDKISSYGVIIRNLREGLIDFPCEDGDFRYYLCWKMDEEAVRHWHGIHEGFSSREALDTLFQHLENS